MDFSAPHVGFVLASYALAFILLGALVVSIWMRARRVRKRLQELERLGAPRRRSATEPQKEQVA